MQLMGHITHLKLAEGQLSVSTKAENDRWFKLVTTEGFSIAVRAMTSSVESKTGLGTNDSRSIARRMLRIIKAEIRENITN